MKKTILLISIMLISVLLISCTQNSVPELEEDVTTPESVLLLCVVCNELKVEEEHCFDWQSEMIERNNARNAERDAQEEKNVAPTPTPEPQSPRFIDYGFTLSEHDVPVKYINQAYENEKDINALVIATDFYIQQSLTHTDWTIEKDDWEWRFLRFTVEYSAARSWDYYFSLFDYNLIDLSDQIKESNNHILTTFIVNYNGSEHISYYYCSYGQSYLNLVEGKGKSDFAFSVLVPEGYDDIVIAFYNGINLLKDPTTYAEIIDEDTVFFRFG